MTFSEELTCFKQGWLGVIIPPGTNKKNKGLMTWAKSPCAMAVLGEWKSLNVHFPCSLNHLTFRGRDFHLSPSIHLFPPRNDSGNPSHSNSHVPPDRILKQIDQGRHLHILRNSCWVLNPTYKTLMHWVKCLSFDWKNTFNKGNSQLNKEATSVYDIHSTVCTHIQSTTALHKLWQNFLLILIPHVSQHTCGPSAFNTIGLCMHQECKFLL